MSTNTFTKIRESLALKLFTIAALVLLLLIPAGMISVIVNERGYRQVQVVEEISSKWADAQTITGPILVVPYKTYTIQKVTQRNEAGVRESRDVKNYGVLKYATFLPDNYTIDGDVQPIIKARGIYEAVLYSGNLAINATFSEPAFDKILSGTYDVLWDQATFSMGINDLKGIRSDISFTVNGDTFTPEPGSQSTLRGTHSSSSWGVMTTVPLSGNENSIEFSTTVSLNGSQSINFLPIGKTTNIEIRSPWSSPSFIGKLLPTESEISKDGFSANWHALSYNRNFPQQWIGVQQLEQETMGVQLVQPVDQYDSVSRSAKYAVLFILLTFVALFIVEIVQKQRIHPVQYLLIGFSLTLFYTLLLAFSEHTGFNVAYIVATIASLGLIGGYIQSILKSAKVTLTLSGLLAILYSFLFITLHQEQYALLMGSIGLFLVLAAIMFITRKIDWYNLNQSERFDFDENDSVQNKTIEPSETATPFTPTESYNEEIVDDQE